MINAFVGFSFCLTLNLLTTTIVAPPSNASKWQMGFNSAFKGCMKNQQIHQLFIQFINYVWQLLHVSALHCHLQGAFLVSSERCSIEEQSLEYCGCGLLCLVTWCAPRTTSLDTTSPIHNILTTAPQFSISQKTLGTLLEDGNVMRKHVGATIHN